MKKFLYNFFKLEENKTNIKTEIIAGVTTFFAMCYIVIVNPNMMIGFFQGSNPELWNAVFIGGIIAAVVGTWLYAFYAKLPFAQAAGMGLNSFFFVTFMIGGMISGHSPIESYQGGLLIILISGLVFIILSITGARQYIARALPDSIKKAIPAGIGLFIAFIGLKGSGIVIGDVYTFVSIANFTSWATAAPALVAFLGLMIIAILGKFKVKGNIAIGVVSSTVLYYLMTWQLPQNLGGFNVGQAFADWAKFGLFGFFNAGAAEVAFGGFTFGGILSAIMLVVTFCMVDMFDTVGTLYGTATEAGMLDEKGDPIRMNQSMLADAIATGVGACVGTSTVTTYVESAAGVSEGGRTGLTSFVTGLLLLLCMFISPIAKIIPSAATAPALIYVGVLMMKSIKGVDFSDIAIAVPAFLTMAIMPLTYSIANGIAVGSIAYVIITLCTGKYTRKDILVTVIAVLFGLKFAFSFMGTEITPESMDTWFRSIGLIK